MQPRTVVASEGKDLSEDDDRFTKTGVFRITREAVEEAMRSQSLQSGEFEVPAGLRPAQDITESKLPLRVVVGLVLFAVTQVLAISGVYYDLRGDVRSLQEAAGTETSGIELTELRLKVEQLSKEVHRLELDTKQPPTVMDNMRRIGELNGDVRELRAMIGSMERDSP